MQEDHDPKKKWNGIQVDGKPLSSYFEAEGEKENKQAITEEIKDKTKTKRRVYIREKHQTKKGRSGKMTTLPQEKLNQTNLENNLTKAKSFKEEIIYYLLSGQKFTATDLQTHYEKRGKRMGRQPIWNCLSNLMRTNLAQYVERKREKKNGNVQFRYWFNSEGVQLQPEGAFELSKHYIKGRGPGQVKGKKKKPGPKPKTTPAQRRAAKGSPVQREIDILKSNLDKVKEITSELMTKAGFGPELNTGADLNLNVTGKVDVVFSFKIGE